MQVIKRNGSSEPFDAAKIDRLNTFATSGLNIDLKELQGQIRFLMYDGMKTSDILRAQVQAASGLISVESPDYTFVAARYQLADLYKHVNGDNQYPHFADTVRSLIAAGRLNPALGSLFDLQELHDAIVPTRDFQFDNHGLQNVIDRYLLRDDNKKIREMPQHFLMRVAMGMALKERDPTGAAISFYHLLSSFDFMSSTPTLFNSGTLHSQMSSCFINTVNDQISAEEDEPRFASIFGTIEECARLSKFAGGIGTDWNRVRAAGGHIKSTNGTSSGVVPYLKIYNDTAVGVNQGGLRKGSFAPYLQPWHPDFWDFCELKKEFGDDRMRAHDIYPAAWVPDLFMERVDQSGMWSFFDPHECPSLNELWGASFNAEYLRLEREGKFRSQRPAAEVWKHILTNLFETGHPWICFKDESNRRSPQQHIGMVRSSNLCTEILENTSDTESAVCNLGSVNIAKHVVKGKIDFDKLRRTIHIAVRMLDNVIDLNFYPSWRARESNLRHRPIGLGMMGYVEALTMCGIDWESEEHLKWADEVFEHFSYYAIEGSIRLASERGSYKSFEGSQWSKGILPIDTARDQTQTLDWNVLRTAIRNYGMRNSNVMAIAPTATISTIVGTTPCIEPPFELQRMEGGMSGKFMVVDPCLRHAPADKVKTVWDIAPSWIIKPAAVRQKWIDQSQSLNIFIKAGTRGRDLAEIYFQAWREGLKTTYYLRGQSKSAAKPQGAAKAVAAVPAVEEIDAAMLCSLENGPSCSACQ